MRGVGSGGAGDGCDSEQGIECSLSTELVSSASLLLAELSGGEAALVSSCAEGAKAF